MHNDRRIRGELPASCKDAGQYAVAGRPVPTSLQNNFFKACRSSTTSSSRDPSEVYWKENKLDFDDKIGELFYDCGRDRASTATALPTLMSLRALDARVAGREVLLVNSATDLDFRSFVVRLSSRQKQLLKLV